MCRGKCYLQKVIETGGAEDASSPAKLPAPETDAVPRHTVPRLLKAGFSIAPLLGKSGILLPSPHSVELPIYSLARPGRRHCRSFNVRLQQVSEQVVGQI